MRIRSSILVSAVLAAAASAPLARAQSPRMGIAIVDNGFASQTAIESAYCPSSPGCLTGRVFHWSCSGGSCTAVVPSSYSPHANDVAKAAAKTLKEHESPTDPGVEFYSIVGNPEAYLPVIKTRIRVVVNTLGTGSVPPSCGAGAAPPLGFSVVRATGNQAMNGFARRTPPANPPYAQGQVDCRPGVTSVAGALELPTLNAGASAWVGDRNGLECTDLGNDNNPCSQYPFFVASNFTPQTTFGAEACLSTILNGSACTSGALVGTSFSAPVVGGAYLALYRRNRLLTPAQVESLLRAHTPDTTFAVNTLGSPFFGQTFSVKVVTPDSIASALATLP